jgi:Methane oxygenase PmoA
MKGQLLVALVVVGAIAFGAGRLGAADPAKVTIKATKDHVDFLAGKDLVGRYHIGPKVAKPYMWPLNGPTGVPVTRAWPMEKVKTGESDDHPHQKSAWFCHGDVIPEGIELKERVRGVEGVDFWAESRGHGKIVCTQVGEPKFDKSHGQITTHNEWRTAGGTKVLDETRTIHLYDFGDTRLFVFAIDLHASVVPITFGDTKEGSMGIRINDKIAEEVTTKVKEGDKIRRKKIKGAGTLENAEGNKGEKKCWGRLSAWCDYSGPLGGKTVGLAILDDPSNPYPACWHSRGYGLMAANPFGRAVSKFPAMKGHTDLVKLAKGKHLKLRYGLLIHPGDAREGKVAEYFKEFVKLKD